jgi:deferrochelatase/peroxidase EfeB
MSTVGADSESVEFSDIQGLLRFAYKHHTEARFLLLRVTNAAAARNWLASAPVANAVEQDQLPQTVLQIALTYEGMVALGVPADIAGGFSQELIVGMSADANRSRRLGDLGPNDPAHWQWGNGDRVPHVAVLLYALPGLLDGWSRQIEAQYTAGFQLIASLSTADMGGIEPFGFIDGISQPQPDWERRREPRDETQLTYGNLGCLGEFLLGYPNEYGLYTPRPLLDPRRDPQGLLPAAEDVPGQRDLGRNGSYLVCRQLRQDVAGFWQALDRYADGHADRRLQLAQALVGRTLYGEPLVGLPHEAIRGNQTSQATLNAFTFRTDPEGVRCPLGAHIRRTNPRNADLPPGKSGPLAKLWRMLGFNAEARGQDLVASTRFHRLLRRGREYGARIALEQALVAGSDSPESGLHFLCLGANIERQFEFVQSAWVANAKFDGLGAEGDPLLGNRRAGFANGATDVFTLPQPDGPACRLDGLPRFITVLGGGYFFMPGLRALRFLAQV